MSGSRLKTGYTTGSCAAAASAAAWLALQESGGPERVSVCFPDGRQRDIPIHEAGVDDVGKNATASVIKDAGDDVDITHGATVRAAVGWIARDEVQESDFQWRRGEAEIVLRAGAGVGRVTRPGLDVPIGRSAINPGPRQMIVETLSRHGVIEYPGILGVTLSIDNGEELAAKTLNPALGIDGGLSILGRSGIVVPCSRKAYIDTIDVLLHGARSSGQETAVLVTGERTLNAARQEYPDLPEMTFVRIGDFIQAALEACTRYGFRKVIVACMPGKLAKYARGIVCTHAHAAGQRMPALLSFLKRELKSDERMLPSADLRSVRELLASVSEKQRKEILELLCCRAQEALRGMVQGGMDLRVDVYDYEGKKAVRAGAEDE